MARITVEDCIDIIPNQFDLVVLASQRSRELAAGLKLTLAKDNDKNPVLALREIAATTVSVDQLRENLIKSLQKHHLEDYVLTEEESLEEDLMIGDDYKMAANEVEEDLEALSDDEDDGDDDLEEAEEEE